MSYAQIAGYSSFLPIYRDWVAQAKDGDVAVEVGVALGHSLAYLAREVIESHKAIEVWCVDPFGGYARNGEQQALLAGSRGDFRLFLDQMLVYAPEELEIVRLIRATSVEASRFFVYKKCDLVLIDAAHDYESVKADIEHWRDVMRPGGWLAGDDHEPNYPGVEKACRGCFLDGYEVRGTAWLKKM
jgi:predicted O-methyltransferase YrrM